MSANPKPRRAFVAVTLITVIAVTTVFIVYAALLASYVGPNVSVSKQGGYIEYSPITTTDWSTNPLNINNGTDWYARLVITGATAQQVFVTWTLHCSNGTKWDKVTYTVSLPGTTTIYPNAADPFTGPGRNWGQDTKNLDATRSFHVNATLVTV